MTERRTAWKAVHPDLRSSHGFRWPWPGNEAAAPLPDGAKFTRGDPCPRFVGDGLCLAKTWRGAASGGIPAITCLLVSFDPADVLGEDNNKVRVSRCRVEDVFDAPALLRSGFGAGADLGWADLSASSLHGADLSASSLRRAKLRRANLGWADLSASSLHGADLSAADLGQADLHGADLRRAKLHGADLRRANLRGADLYGANLSGADLYGANLSGVSLYGATGRDDWGELVNRGAIR